MNKVQTQWLVFALLVGGATLQAEPMVYINKSSAVTSRSVPWRGEGFRPVERGWARKNQDVL